MYNSKKGVSEIVSTILIILLVLAAIIIVWQAVKGLIEDQSTTVEAKAACLDVVLSIEDDKLDCTGGVADVWITRGGDSKTVGTMIIAVGQKAHEGKVAPSSLGTSSFLNLAGGTGETVAKGTIVKVAPVVKVNGKDITCAPTDTATCP